MNQQGGLILCIGHASTQCLSANERRKEALALRRKLSSFYFCLRLLLFIGSPAKQALHKTIVFAALLSRNLFSTSCRRKVFGTTLRASNLILFLSILTALKRLLLKVDSESFVVGIRTPK